MSDSHQTGSVEGYSPSMDPQLLLVLNEEAAACSVMSFLSSAHPFRLCVSIPNVFYF